MFVRFVTHYVRSLEGMTFLSEAMDRLQWSSLFEKHSVQKYVEQLKLRGICKEQVEK